MDKVYIRNLQKRITDLVRKYNKSPLYIAVKDTCSEIARIVGFWISQKYRNSELHVLKGKINKNLYHDILLVMKKEKFYLIDPTIWQINKNKRSIFLGGFKSQKESLEFLKKNYGGSWKVPENFFPIFKLKSKLMNIIKINLTE